MSYRYTVSMWHQGDWDCYGSDCDQGYAFNLCFCRSKREAELRKSFFDLVIPSEAGQTIVSRR